MLLRFGFLIAGLVIGLDQVSKVVVDTAMTPYRPVGVLPFLNLTLTFNTGAAFSFLAEAAGWQRWFFVVLALGVSAYLIWWLRQLSPAERWQAAALGLILGGAIGNVIDRVVRGHVVDFVDVYYGSWHWPAFNVADSAITVGVTLLILQMLMEMRRGG